MSKKGKPMAKSDTNRLEAFSDGVFSIAITLLILEIKVPHGEEIAAAGGLWPALGHHWASFVGYATSFLTIGIMWANHHSIFTYIHRVNRSFLMANLFLLMMISFLPFPTAVLAEHLPDPAHRVGAVALYEVTLVLIAVSFNLVWWMGIRGRRLVEHEIDEAGLKTMSRRYRFGPPGFMAATALVFVSVWASLALNVVLAGLYALSEKSRDAELEGGRHRGNRKMEPETETVGSANP
jgi:uncharacterized membrane protein